MTLSDSETDGSVWFCMDVSQNFLKYDAYLMSPIDKLLDQLGVAHFYLTLDLTKVYLADPLDSNIW